MARMTIRSTFSLDRETVDALDPSSPESARLRDFQRFQGAGLDVVG